MDGISMVITGVIGLFGTLVVLAVLYGILRVVIGWTYRIPQQGQALVRTGVGGIRIAFESGIFVFPIVHRLEIMDISVKRVEIHREGSTGLICKDNLRADIKVTFYVRVDSKSPDHVKAVAQILGCQRASDTQVLAELFEPKFSDALKTAGRDFNFEDLLNKRAEFRDAIKVHVGTDLNGYILDDAAIDILEQSKVEKLDPNNILDAEGIKLITERTAVQAILTNERNRDKEREINKKNVETREIVLEQNKQLAEAEEKQKREVASIKAREEAETIKFQQEQRLRHEKARIASDEEIQVSEENKNRQIIVAARNRERTDGVEQVRVQKDRQLEDVERDKVVSLAAIEKTKVVETEQKNIQEVIRARVAVQKDVVVEEQRIKDTEAFATAEREKKVVITMAEAEAEQAVVRQVKAAEAAKQAAELKAEQDLLVVLKAAEAQRQAAALLAEKRVTEATGEQEASARIATGKKALAEGITAEQAAAGLAEANVIAARAAALQKQGETEASVAQLKFKAEADGITKKAEAMKLFHEAGRQHEEFKLRLGVEKDIALADIAVRKDIAASQAEVLGEALSHAKVDIVGGETQFFSSVVNAVTGGRMVDHAVDSSRVLGDVHAALTAGGAEGFAARLRELLARFPLGSEDVKNLTIAAALAKLAGVASGADAKRLVRDLLTQAQERGLAEKRVGDLPGGGA